MNRGVLTEPVYPEIVNMVQKINENVHIGKKSYV